MALVTDCLYVLGRHSQSKAAMQAESGRFSDVVENDQGKTRLAAWRATVVQTGGEGSKRDSTKLLLGAGDADAEPRQWARRLK